ncbi:hypothetical protein K440DRAFT_623970 [Wilcoxina mikolae CBS 423.85]|nr:hypothetical protein K440DRAFT_623970 [Wilcoxina mikolae CBS 423.85]
MYASPSITHAIATSQHTCTIIINVTNFQPTPSSSRVFHYVPPPHAKSAHLCISYLQPQPRTPFFLFF